MLSVRATSEYDIPDSRRQIITVLRAAIDVLCLSVAVHLHQDSGISSLTRTLSSCGASGTGDIVEDSRVGNTEVVCEFLDGRVVAKPGLCVEALVVDFGSSADAVFAFVAPDKTVGYLKQ